jgi:hypothetical protein
VCAKKQGEKYLVDAHGKRSIGKNLSCCISAKKLRLALHSIRASKKAKYAFKNPLAKAKFSEKE